MAITINGAATVTVAELDDYWHRHGWDSHEKITANMVADIKAHREPEYEEGAVYRDAYGEIWQYGNKTWRAFGTLAVAKFGLPKRPLRKLVPETIPEEVPPEPVRMVVTVDGSIDSEDVARQIRKAMEPEKLREY